MWYSENLHLQLQEMSRGSLTEKEEAGKISVYGKTESVKVHFMYYTWEDSSIQIFGQTF